MGSPPNNHHHAQSYHQPGGYHANNDMTMHQQPHHDNYRASQQHLQVPGQQQYGPWRQASPERHHNYPPAQPGPMYYPDEDYSPDHYPSDHYADNYVDVQRPPPSHVHTPPEVQQHSYSHGYFPQPEWDQEDYQYSHNNNNNWPHASSERLMGPQRQQYHNAV